MSNSDWHPAPGPAHRLYEYVGGPKCGSKCAIPSEIPEWGVWKEVIDPAPFGIFVDFPEGSSIQFDYRIEPGKLILQSERIVGSREP